MRKFTINAGIKRLLSPSEQPLKLDYLRLKELVVKHTFPDNSVRRDFFSVDEEARQLFTPVSFSENSAYIAQTGNFITLDKHGRTIGATVVATPNSLEIKGPVNSGPDVSLESVTIVEL